MVNSLQNRQSKRVLQGSGVASAIFSALKAVAPHLLPAISTLAQKGAEGLGDKLKKLISGGGLQREQLIQGLSALNVQHGRGAKLPGSGSSLPGGAAFLPGKKKTTCVC